MATLRRQRFRGRVAVAGIVVGVIGAGVFGAVGTVSSVSAVSGSAGAHDVGCRAFNTRTHVVYNSERGSALQTAIDRARPRDRLEVSGRCTGAFRIDKDLQLQGRSRAGAREATLVGIADRPVVAVGVAVVRIRDVRITHGITSESSTRSHGVTNTGWLTLARSTIDANSAAAGGGIANDGTLDLVRSTVSANFAGSGGAIFNRGTLRVMRSTIAENTSSGDGGGISNEGNMRISHSTIAHNVAMWTGGGVDMRPSAPTVPMFEASIIAANLAGASGPDCAGDVVSNGYNVVGTTDGFFCAIAPSVGDTIGYLEAVLEPLAANGGPTRTLALVPGNAAVDAMLLGANGADGVTPLCRSGMRDQRGVEVPQGNGCDIGAYELDTTT